MAGSVLSLGPFAKPMAWWRHSESEAANRQGWDLFDVSGVCCIDRHDGAGVFDTDTDAVEHVVSRAMAGDLLAAKALYLDGRACSEEVWMPKAMRGPTNAS